MRLLAAVFALAVSAQGARAQNAGSPARRVLESFDDASAFQALPSDGVRLELRGDSGVVGRALRMDFDFQGRAGYAVARRAFALPPLPAYWAITLRVRGEAKPNTLELKLVDSSGQNVWWMRRPELQVSRGWTELRFRPSHLSYAWGPLGGGPPRAIAALEIAFTAGQGGTGWLALDDLALTPLAPPVPDRVRPSVSASSTLLSRPAALVVPADFATAPRDTALASEGTGWRSGADGEQWLALDFGGPRPLSGLVLDWSARDWAVDYDVETSDDGRAWTVVRSVRGGGGGRRWIHLPGTEAAGLRLTLKRSSRGMRYALRALRVLSDSAAPTRSAFLERVAQGSVAGAWPRPLTGQQSYWTVVGLPRDERDALVSEDGSVESRPGGFSLEPFLHTDGRLLTWRDGTVSHTLDGGSLPIPTARRIMGDLELATTAYATGTPGASVVWVRYDVVNRSRRIRRVRLFAAVRPVQVNPPWQFLGIAGGAAQVRSIRADRRSIVVNDSDVVAAFTPPTAAGVIAFDSGSVTDAMRRGEVPRATTVDDPTGLAEGAFAWTLVLGARDSAQVWLALPAPGMGTAIPDLRDAELAARTRVIGAQRLSTSRDLWTGELGAVSIDLPGTGAALARTVRTALAHVLINARGPAIQPGTRSYRRSWIRDGALTSSALMRMGHADDARAFLDWFVPYLFPDGKVPCCVDHRGADPVTENDADGELLYLAAEHFRITGDSATVRRHWTALARVAAHLDSLRNTRRTSRYRTPDSPARLRPPPAVHQPRGLLGQAGLFLLGRLVGGARARRRRAAGARGRRRRRARRGTPPPAARCAPTSSRRWRAR